ncbi:MAG: efflux RND transporter periplasmic adaptor subunit [Desulfobacterales bacterium]|nr:efflux RND transporter periplasmic adaptor subunit [Desulfobacterales bacterium]
MNICDDPWLIGTIYKIKGLVMKIKLIYSVTLIFIFFLFSCGGKEKQETKIIKPMKFASVVQEGGTIVKTFNGTSQSGAETRLSFRTNGLIVKLNAKIGDKVKKGNLLAQLDLNDLQLNYQKATSAQQSAKSHLETARSGFERVKELYQANSASLSDYEQAKNNYLAAQSSYQTAKKTLELQERQIDYAKIFAPTAGTVSAVNVELNEFAAAGNPVIIINSDNDDIEVTVGVTENYISRIFNGDEAEVVFSGIEGQKFKGLVTEVGFSSAQTATSPVVLKLANVSKQVRPGMSVEVHFSFGNTKETPTLSVPVSAVGEDHDGAFVYVLKQQNEIIYTTVKTIIQTGKLTNNGYEVLSGVHEGDYVATAGIRSLYDGMEVKLLHD